MRIKENALLQFTVSAFIAILASSIPLGLLLNKRLAGQIVYAHISLFPQIVAQTVKDRPALYGFFNSPKDPGLLKHAELFVADLLSFGSVYKVKLWDKSGNIIWSDDKALIGRNFNDDPNFRQALGASVSSALKVQSKAENISEKKGRAILEIYVPVARSGEVIGVVSICESARRLLNDINKNKFTVWIWVACAGVFIYVFLFFIFFAANKRQKTANLQLRKTLESTIYILAYLSEIRDSETARHLERTALYVEIIAKELQRSSPYSKYLSGSYIYDLVKSSPLHDVGKVGVLDAILRKPGRLSPEEFSEIKKHSAYGAKILQEAESKLGFQSLLTISIQIAKSHHERWDGNGYPEGLRADKIPLSARIMALADVYDALRSKRCYKDALSHQQSREIIMNEKGRQFDPYIVDAFLRQEKEFERISTEMAD